MTKRAIRMEAFSLVEVTLALGVAAFALLAIFGLLPLGVSSNQTSFQQTAATNIATEIVSDLSQVPSAATIAAAKTSPRPAATSLKYGVDVSLTGATFYLDDSASVIMDATQARYKAVVSLLQPAAGQRTATFGNISISWPALAANPQGTVVVGVALDRN